MKENLFVSLNATLDTKLRVFQYKILNRILHTNSKSFAFKVMGEGENAEGRTVWRLNFKLYTVFYVYKLL